MYGINGLFGGSGILVEVEDLVGSLATVVVQKLLVTVTCAGKRTLPAKRNLVVIADIMGIDWDGENKSPGNFLIIFLPTRDG